MVPWLLGLALAAPYGAKTPDSLLTHMEAHFAAATDASWGVAVGDLEQVQAQAQLLAQKPPPVLPPSWRPRLRRMQDAAKSLSAADSLDVAATRVAALGATCVGCHTSVPEGPNLAPDEVKMQVLTPVGEHALAPYWLWLGFVMNSDAAWNNGAKALVGSPAKAGAEPFAAAYDALAAQTKVVPREGREALMAKILGSCVPCHQGAKVTVQP